MTEYDPREDFVSTYEPELGQALFGGPWEEVAAPEYVETGLELLGQAIEIDLLKKWEAFRGVGIISNPHPPGNPMGNTGQQVEYETFTARAYCWCDGSQHPEGCPPNLEVPGAPGGPLAIRWYKYNGRGVSMNRPVSPEEWWQVLKMCMDAVWS